MGIVMAAVAAQVAQSRPQMQGRGPGVRSSFCSAQVPPGVGAPSLSWEAVGTHGALTGRGASGLSTVGMFGT